jgi:hypothetical protein
MAIPGSDRRTAPLKTTCARRTPTRAASTPLTAAPRRFTARHPLPRRHPRAMPHAVASSSPRIEAALMLAPPRNSASTLAHDVAQGSRRCRVGIAGNVAPIVARLSRVNRVTLATCSRIADAKPSPAMRFEWRANLATFSLCLRRTRAIVLACWRECDAIMALMNRYPLCNGGATDPTASRHTPVTRRPALDLELEEMSS